MYSSAPTFIEPTPIQPRPFYDYSSSSSDSSSSDDESYCSDKEGAELDKSIFASIDAKILLAKKNAMQKPHSIQIPVIVQTPNPSPTPVSLPVPVNLHLSAPEPLPLLIPIPPHPSVQPPQVIHGTDNTNSDFPVLPSFAVRQNIKRSIESTASILTELSTAAETVESSTKKRSREEDTMMQNLKTNKIRMITDEKQKAKIVKINTKRELKFEAKMAKLNSKLEKQRAIERYEVPQGTPWWKIHTCLDCDMHVNPSHRSCPTCKGVVSKACGNNENGDYCGEYYTIGSVCPRCYIQCKSCKRGITHKDATDYLKQADIPCEYCDNEARIKLEECIVVFLPFNGNFYRCPNLMPKSVYNPKPVTPKQVIDAFGGYSKCAVFRIYKRNDFSPIRTNGLVNYLKTPVESRDVVYYIDGEDLIRYSTKNNHIGDPGEMEKMFSLLKTWGTRKPFVSKYGRPPEAITPKSVKSCVDRWMVTETNLVSMDSKLEGKRPCSGILSTLYYKDKQTIIKSIFDVFNRRTALSICESNDTQKYKYLEFNSYSGVTIAYLHGPTSAALENGIKENARKYLIDRKLNKEQKFWERLCHHIGKSRGSYIQP